MPDLSIEKLAFFLFAVLPGFIAIQVYAMKCPGAKRDWANSLMEAVTYSLVNLTIWGWWVVPLVKTPFTEVAWVDLAAAVICVCFGSPILLALGWYWLRTTYLHRRLRLDHPTPRGWDHFVKSNHEYWVLFHLKNGKLLGGYFGGDSYAATFPQEPEMYVEEIWRVNERGQFVEMVEGTLGGVIRLSECERVEFLKAKPEENANGPEEGNGRPATATDGGQAGAQPGGADGCGLVAEQQPQATPGRLGNGTPEQSTQVT